MLAQNKHLFSRGGRRCFKGNTEGSQPRPLGRGLRNARFARLLKDSRRDRCRISILQVALQNTPTCSHCRRSKYLSHRTSRQICCDDETMTKQKMIGANSRPLRINFSGLVKAKLGCVDKHRCLNPNCTDTYMNYTWTIPMDSDVSDSKFTMTVYDVTNRSDISMLQSNLFFINADNGTSTADSNASTSTPESSQEISASTGLATGAKAGIGAGIGVLALILLLAGFFLYRRKKRQTTSIAPTDGFEKPELDAKSTGISEVDGSGISPHQAPDNAIYEAPGV
ncbi:Uncharacterized protein HZ326_4220 [Fusarium oxysporum f. sp. albedinis]|nr:Uncharacterized protein HZ326_4220 [Fusarium oxysporum f. sp. albedinis]